MKIGSCLSKNIYKCYSEARGIAQNKRIVLKKRKSKTVTFLQTSIINSFLLLVIILCFVLYYNLSFLFLLLSLLPLLFNHIYIFFYLRKVKNHRKFSFNVFDEEGIHDDSFYGIKMIFPWKKIKGIVVGKYSIVVLTDTPCYFYYGIDSKNDILKAVDLYSKKKKIIY